MHNYTPVAFFDDAGQHGERGRQAGVLVGEDIHIRAFSPVYVDGRVDSFLDVSTVEIER